MYNYIRNDVTNPLREFRMKSLEDDNDEWVTFLFSYYIVVEYIPMIAFLVSIIINFR